MKAAPARLPYRLDIDGLRAVAVTAVILFHYRVPPFWGGFTGVDIFFVISGFLITGLIRRDLEQGSFSIARFYERRVRRIAPALVVMVFAVAVPSAIFLLPADLKRFGQSLVALAVFSSNMEFWRELGYFDPIGQARPLLHTWSISVEEQYYLLVPALLWGLYGAGRRVNLAVMGGLLALSFAFCLWCAWRWPSAGYFWLAARFWEIALGGMLALLGTPRLSAPAAAGLSFVGAVLVGLGFVAVDSNTPFPGFAALLPTLGTALLLWSGNEAQPLVSRMLARRGPVFVGRISYSLYLWHWPPALFLVYLTGLEPTLMQAAAMFALSLLLATLSWWLVERPFREGRLLARRRDVFRAAGFSAVGMAVLGIVLFALKGIPSRLAIPAQRAADYQSRVMDIKTPCFVHGLADVLADRLCVLGARDAPPSFILWGDSHAGALAGAVSDAAAQAGVAGYEAAWTGCPPFAGIDTPDVSADCSELRDAVIARALHSDIHTIVLAEYWPAHMLDSMPRPIIPTEPLWISGRGREAQERIAAKFSRDLRNFVKLMTAAGKRVIIVMDAPEVGWSVPERLALAKQWGTPLPQPPTRAEYLARQKPFRRLAEELKAQYGLGIIYSDTVLCAPDRCRVEQDGIPLYYDDNHLAPAGAALFIPALFHALRPPS